SLLFCGDFWGRHRIGCQPPLLLRTRVQRHPVAQSAWRCDGLGNWLSPSFKPRAGNSGNTGYAASLSTISTHLAATRHSPSSCPRGRPRPSPGTSSLSSRQTKRPLPSWLNTVAGPHAPVFASASSSSSRCSDLHFLFSSRAASCQVPRHSGPPSTLRSRY
ncbi:hypothetical protein CAOG_08626, partial [Capsaspora owczarzaki ATCC 30864]|uniref:hypothetical protein n=1 Tax=Capsaspora owczarzaki (strain ATCC 30864) TaxID=595528 RepID=UPI0003526634